MCCVELFVCVETDGKWLAGDGRIGFGWVSAVEVFCDNVFVDVCNEESGGFGSDLSVYALLEGVELGVGKCE